MPKERNFWCVAQGKGDVNIFSTTSRILEFFRYKKNAETYLKREQERILENSRWDVYRYDDDDVLHLFPVTREQVMAYKQREYEECLEKARKTYLDSHDSKRLVSACRQVVHDLCEKLATLSNIECRQLFRDRKTVYSPWRNYSDVAIVIAGASFVGEQGIALVGGFLHMGNVGHVFVEMEHFGKVVELMEYLSDEEKASKEFLRSMVVGLYKNFLPLLELPVV